MTARRVLGLALLGLIVLWVGLPAARAIRLIEQHAGQPIAAPHDLAVQPVKFRADDGVPLRGWFVAGSSDMRVVLVAGFKSDRMSMVPYAHFLHAAGFSVLLYDSRGTGESGGRFSVGAGEVHDVLGAIDYLTFSHGPGTVGVGLLGVSLGAGDVISAAARSRAVRATVADSAYTDQTAVVSDLNQLQVGPLDLPLAPVAGPIIDRLAHVTVSSFRPIADVGKVAPGALFLIHSRLDANPTTPLSGVLRLRRAARQPVQYWLAPLGGHAGALAAQPTAYQRRVVAFFQRYLSH